MTVLYAEFKGREQFLSTPTPIPGLSLTIPEGADEMALIMLNVPASYSVRALGIGGSGWFGLSVDGTMLPAYATYTSPVPDSFGPSRMPATLVVAVPMKLTNQTVVAYAQTCIIDSLASLTVII